ncbi:MAG: hypothetical protein STSR0008_23860 [Ignavibacterium sp.]
MFMIKGIDYVEEGIILYELAYRTGRQKIGESIAMRKERSAFGGEYLQKQAKRFGFTLTPQLKQ